MLRWQLPEYVSDAMPAEARRLEDLRRDLLDLDDYLGDILAFSGRGD